MADENGKSESRFKEPIGGGETESESSTGEGQYGEAGAEPGAESPPGNEAPSQGMSLPCDQCDKLMAYVSEVIRKTMDPNVTAELSYVLRVLPELRRRPDDGILELARMSINCLSEEPANLELAKVLNREIKKKLSLFVTLTEILKSSRSSFNYVFLGLLFFLYGVAPISAILLKDVPLHSHEFLGIDLYTFMIVIAFGALGSIVSMLSRIKDYAASTEKDLSILFYTGMLKPVIGAAFALFVFSLVKGKLLPVAIAKDTEISIYIAMSFLSGFSERFTKDVIGNAEKLGMNGGK